MIKRVPVTGLTPGERAYIRRELDLFFSTVPTVAEGFPLKTWRGGPEAGKPQLPPVARGLLDRGLMRLDTSQRLPRLFITEAGPARHNKKERFTALLHHVNPETLRLA